MRQGRRLEAGSGILNQAVTVLIHLKSKSCLGNSGRAICSNFYNKHIHPGLPGACVSFLGDYKYTPITVLFS